MLLWRKRKKGKSTAQEAECLQTTEDWTALCAALTCPNHTVILGEPFRVWCLTPWMNLTFETLQNPRLFVRWPGLQIWWNTVTRRGMEDVVLNWGILRGRILLRSSVILEPRLFTKGQTLSISALISMTTATGNCSELRIPKDETLMSTSLDYNCSTDLTSDMDDSFSHSSEIPSKLCHQEKDHTERYGCFLQPLS